MHIEMGDDERYNVTGIGTITFQRESSSPLRLKDMIFVPSLKMNLVFIIFLEDCSYGMIFSKRKKFLRHIGT